MHEGSTDIQRPRSQKDDKPGIQAPAPHDVDQDGPGSEAMHAVQKQLPEEDGNLIFQHHHLMMLNNQSINQSNFHSTNITGKVRVSGATTKSVFNSSLKESPITSMGHWACQCLWGKVK